MSKTQSFKASDQDKSRITELLRRFSDQSNSLWMQYWNDLIDEFISQGYSRFMLYSLIMSIETEKSNLTESQSGFLFDFETSITGQCSYDCILGFPNEPTERADLLSYIYKNQWKIPEPGVEG